MSAMARPRSTHRATCTTGRSDNFTQAQPSTYLRDARFDPESICVARDGASVFISDEYGPCIDRFDRRTGERIAVYRVPASFAVTTLSPVGNDEISQDARAVSKTSGESGLAP
jgi:sugar lactone lactonase YvrE